MINQLTFQTSELHVKAGTTVTFDNQDGQAHTATADHDEFKTGTIDPGTSKQVTVMQAGIISYHCSFHSFMKAKIVVE